MKTKRETLKFIAQYGQCGDCINCPYDKEEVICSLLLEIRKLGAKEMLKSLPQEFDKTKILESKPKIEPNMIEIQLTKTANIKFIQKRFL